jgi:hypothetical protein
VLVALWILAFLTHFTAVQRLIHVWRQTLPVEQQGPESKAS